MRPPLLPSAACLCLLTVVALAADRAPIKPGLWEFTHQTDVGGRVPIPDDLLAKMPPDARARMEAALQGRGGGGAHSSRQCITDRDRSFRVEDDHQHCTNKLVSQTATSMELAVECTDAGNHGGGSRGTLKWNAPNPETVSGTIDLTITQGAQTMQSHATIAGRWLGADCGDVKPRPQD